MILMALSNKFGHLLLTTGNKSELAVGYCTIYGDMAGGLAVISDVPKTMVYELARLDQSGREIIPGSTIEKPPERGVKTRTRSTRIRCRPTMCSMQILRLYVEENLSAREIIAQRFRREDRALDAAPGRSERI